MTWPWTAGGQQVRLFTYGYRSGGHHILAKQLFKGDDAYLNAQGLSIPMAELEKLGVLHPKLTGAQRRLYVEFGKSGRLLTLDGVAAIETRALIEVGVPKRLAHRLVRTALDDLTATTGITMPRNIPWVGPNSKGVV